MLPAPWPFPVSAAAGEPGSPGEPRPRAAAGTDTRWRSRDCDSARFPAPSGTHAPSARHPDARPIRSARQVLATGRVRTRALGFGIATCLGNVSLISAERIKLVYKFDQNFPQSSKPESKTLFTLVFA